MYFLFYLLLLSPPVRHQLHGHHDRVPRQLHHDDLLPEVPAQGQRHCAGQRGGGQRQAEVPVEERGLKLHRVGTEDQEEQVSYKGINELIL